MSEIESNPSASSLRDIISVNVNVFNGEILLCDSYLQDVAPEELRKMANGKHVFSFTPELTHADILGFKLCTIFRLKKVEKLTVFVKSGSPHSLQIPLFVQEAAEDAGFDKNAISYFVWEKGEVIPISDASVRKARHLHEIEALLPYDRLKTTTDFLRKNCPNDRKETLESVLDHLFEEVGELKEEMLKGQSSNYKEELGDVLFNIYLFSRIAEEKGLFDFKSLVDSANAKMVERHKDLFK